MSRNKDILELLREYERFDRMKKHAADEIEMLRKDREWYLKILYAVIDHVDHLGSADAFMAVRRFNKMSPYERHQANKQPVDKPVDNTASYPQPKSGFPTSVFPHA